MPDAFRHLTHMVCEMDNLRSIDVSKLTIGQIDDLIWYANAIEDDKYSIEIIEKIDGIDKLKLIKLLTEKKFNEMDASDLLEIVEETEWYKKRYK